MVRSLVDAWACARSAGGAPRRNASAAATAAPDRTLPVPTRRRNGRAEPARGQGPGYDDREDRQSDPGTAARPKRTQRRLTEQRSDQAVHRRKHDVAAALNDELAEEHQGFETGDEEDRQGSQ